LDSISPAIAAPSILRRRGTARGHHSRPYPGRPRGRSGAFRRDALDLIAAAEFDGLYCTIELPGRADGWEVGTTFSYIWPDRPVVYASAISAPPGPLPKGVFLRKPFAGGMIAKAFGWVGAARAGSAAQPQPKNPTAGRIKPARGSVHTA